MKLKKKILACAMAALLLVGASLTMTSCGAEKANDTKKVKDAGKLVVGITEYAPMDYRDENGNWTGFDAEFAELFAKELGVAAELFVIDWDNKLFELESGSIDCIWNGMTITNDILEACAVSDPYVRNQQVVVMKADAAAGYADFDSMKGLTFAAEAGSAGEAVLKDSEVANITSVNAQSDALLEVEAGSADACVIDATMAAAMTGEGTSYADLVKAVDLSDEEYGVAFRKGSDLCAKFNEFMQKLIADGTLKTLADKYCLTLVTK